MGGGGLRYMEINRNIKESHKKTWTFPLIVFWGGALWMAIYSLPSPPSLWRKLFCKLIIQICQNARIRTIYMADILFVVSASLCLNTSPAETQATKAPSPLLPYHEKLELNSSLASTSSFPKDLVRSPDPTWFPGSLFFSHLLDWEEITRERGGTIRQDISWI